MLVYFLNICSEMERWWGMVHKDADAVADASGVRKGNCDKGNSMQGSNCEVCQQTIVDKMRRHYPAQCGKCWARTLARNSKYPVV